MRVVNGRGKSVHAVPHVMGALTGVLSAVLAGITGIVAGLAIASLLLDGGYRDYPGFEGTGLYQDPTGRGWLIPATVLIFLLFAQLSWRQIIGKELLTPEG